MKSIQKYILISAITIFTIWFGKIFPIYVPPMFELDITTKSEEVLSKMSIEEKVGQLFVFGYWGVEPTEQILDMIKNNSIGGVILLGYNIESEQQIKRVTSTLQSVSKFPLFVSIDQEGGIVSRVKFEDTSGISQYQIESEEDAYDIAKKRGSALRNLGINLNYSPVLDDITSSESFLYSRVFRKDQEESAKLAIGMIEGYQDSGILSCIKHFPGHDNRTFDSHSSLDSVYISKDDLVKYIDQFIGPLKYTDAVMVGHILFPLIDSENPVSVSKYFLTDILRKQLGFNGLIITDDMQMSSIYDRYTAKDAAVKAINAGNDMVMYIGKSDEQVEVYNAVLTAVRDGDILESDLNMKVSRILRYKYSLQ